MLHWGIWMGGGLVERGQVGGVEAKRKETDKGAGEKRTGKAAKEPEGTLCQASP